MNGTASAIDDHPGHDGAWWYRTTGGISGPVSSAELKRLHAGGPLGADTLVWRDGFGHHWRRLVDAPPAADSPGPPQEVHGRWAASFARFESEPRKAQWSWLGLLGPLAYLYLGMWRKALVIIAADLVLEAVLALADFGAGSVNHTLPDVLMAGFCAWNLKADYHRHRVLGETMWPRLRALNNGWACATLPVAGFAMLAAAVLYNPADGLMADVTGVWQGEDANVTIDVAGSAKRISYGGRSYAVRTEKVEGESIVFDVVGSPKRITLSRRWSEDHASWTLDLFEGDELLANLSYLKPV